MPPMETPDHSQIATLAHELWMERGCPEGSPEIDWENARQMLASPLKRNWSARVETAVGVNQATGAGSEADSRRHQSP